MIKAIAGVWFLLGVWAAIVSAFGAPPEGADPALGPWYKSLRNPERGFACCDLSDCRPTEWRTEAGNVLAWVGEAFGRHAGGWVVVPPEAVIRRSDNPEGRAVLCWRPNVGVLCFVKGPET